MGNMYADASNFDGGAYSGWGLWIHSGSTGLHWRAGSRTINLKASKSEESFNIDYGDWLQLAIVRKNNEFTFHLFNENTGNKKKPTQ